MAISDWGHPVGFLGRGTISTFPLGAIRQVSYTDTSGTETKEPQKQVFLINKTGGATIAGGVYMIAYDGDEETNPKCIACAAVTVDVNTVVATEVLDDAECGWFVYAGYCNAMVDGDATDVAKDDTLKIVAGTNADAFIQDTASAVRTADSAGIACEANTGTQALKKVFLFGDRHDID